MYKMDYDRAVLALWDPELKEKIHEAYYENFPNFTRGIFDPQLGIKNLRDSVRKTSMIMVETLAKFILDLEEPDTNELYTFIGRYSIFFLDRIERILDREEIKEQVKRRGLV